MLQGALYLSINHYLLHHLLSEVEENVTKSKERLPELHQDSLWVCFISVVPEGQLRTSGEKDRRGGLGVRVCVHMYGMEEGMLQTNEVADCMSGPAGFLKNRSQKTQCVLCEVSVVQMCDILLWMK